MPAAHAPTTNAPRGHLCTEESETVAIEQTFTGEQTCKNSSKKPQNTMYRRCTTGSSIFNTLSMKSTENIITTPHIAPIKAAPAGDTASHPAVMPTSPAKIPFSVNDREGFIFHPAHQQSEETTGTSSQIRCRIREMATASASVVLPIENRG